MRTKIYTIKMYYYAMVTLLFLPGIINAQQNVRALDVKTMEELKKEGKLTGNERFIHYESKGNTVFPITAPVNRVHTAGDCNCWVDRDSTWSIVPFVIGTPPDYRNDDGSSQPIALPFSFCFYNTPVDTIFINNNGNISMGSPYSIYSPNSFPDTTFEMIAPLWSDVDTRNLASGLVYYKLTSQYLIIQWDSVGYYNSHSDKVNTFQLIITNGVSEIIPRENNVSFCYKDMQWTTGDASITPPVCPTGGSGFGGCPATAGVNKGDGIHYIQLGLFDQAGSAYDGPFGNTDGIDALDNQYFYFKVCDSTANIPPIVHSPQICDSLTICVGDSILLDADYLSPEAAQITTVSYSTSATSGVTLVSSTSGNTAHITVQILGQLANLGYNTIDLIGTDNGTPAQTSTTSFVVNVQSCGVGISENQSLQEISIYPNPADENIHIMLNKLNLKNFSVILTDQLGKKVFDKMFDRTDSFKEITIPSKNLPKGIYFLSLKNEKESIVKRIEVIHHN